MRGAKKHLPRLQDAAREEGEPLTYTRPRVQRMSPLGRRERETSLRFQDDHADLLRLFLGTVGKDASKGGKGELRRPKLHRSGVAPPGKGGCGHNYAPEQSQAEKPAEKPADDERRSKISAHDA